MTVKNQLSQLGWESSHGLSVVDNHSYPFKDGLNHKFGAYQANLLRITNWGWSSKGIEPLYILIILGETSNFLGSFFGGVANDAYLEHFGWNVTETFSRNEAFIMMYHVQYPRLSKFSWYLITSKALVQKFKRLSHVSLFPGHASSLLSGQRI